MKQKAIAIVNSRSCQAEEVSQTLKQKFSEGKLVVNKLKITDKPQHLKLAPDHTLPKPTLRALIYKTGKSISRLYLSFLLYLLSLGRLQRNFTSFEAREIELEVSPNQPASYDGEVYSKGPYKIAIKKPAARIIS